MKFIPRKCNCIPTHTYTYNKCIYNNSLIVNPLCGLCTPKKSSEKGNDDGRVRLANAPRLHIERTEPNGDECVGIKTRVNTA